MELHDQLKALSTRIAGQLGDVETEEATKTAFILPFVAALGYNVFDPTEVVPEYTADVGKNNREKVDLAVMKDGQPIILIECKPSHTDLSTANKNQLYRYFTSTSARIGILGNGVSYEFYSDLDAPNRMDERPFLVIDMLKLQDRLIDELARLQKGEFDQDEVVAAAADLKYTRAIRRFMAKQFTDPDEDFIKLVLKNVYDRMITAKVKEDFTPIVKAALRMFLNEQVDRRLRSALEQDDITTPSASKPIPDAAPEEEITESVSDIVTTEEEHEGFMIVRAILREVADPDRVVMRDQKSYCGVLLDDNNRKPICRFHFSRTKRSIEIFDAEKVGRRVELQSLSGIYGVGEELKQTVGHYDA